MNSFGLDEKTVEKIFEVFKKTPKIKSVKVFGSRAKGNFKSGSDVDLVIYGLNDELELGLVALELNELMTPYKFDVKSYELLNHESLKSHIDRVGKDFYVAL